MGRAVNGTDQEHNCKEKGWLELWRLVLEFHWDPARGQHEHQSLACFPCVLHCIMPLNIWVQWKRKSRGDRNTEVGSLSVPGQKEEGSVGMSEREFGAECFKVTLPYPPLHSSHSLHLRVFCFICSLMFYSTVSTSSIFSHFFFFASNGLQSISAIPNTSWNHSLLYSQGYKLINMVDIKFLPKSSKCSTWIPGTQDKKMTIRLFPYKL